MKFDRVTSYLFIGTPPSVEDYPRLRGLGVRPVINMRFDHPPYLDPHPTPIDLLWLRTIDSLFFPIPITKLIQSIKKPIRNTVPP